MYKYLYLLGQFLRNSKISQHEKELKRTDFSSIETLHELQLTRLKKLLKHAIKNSEFYKKSLEGFDIEQMTLEKLSQIPILKKKTLLDNIDKIQNYIPNEKFFSSATSGSTGDALKYDRNIDWDAATRAAQLRAYSWYGINPWMRNVYFWGYNPNFLKKLKMRFTDALLNRKRIFDYNEETFFKVSEYLKKCSYIEGYSSSIFTLSKFLEKNKYSYDNIKMVKGTSEVIHEYYQQSIKNVFKAKMISEYGAAESGLISYECPEGNAHIIMENVIVEEIDQKIVITNLFSYSLPIIRYELGDYIKLDKRTKCRCGRLHYIIQEINGRLGFDIYGQKNIYPSLSINYIFKNLVQSYDYKVAYYAEQHEKGKIKCKVMYDGDRHNELIRLIEEQSLDIYSTDLEIEIIFVNELEHKDRKSHCFESYIEGFTE